MELYMLAHTYIKMHSFKIIIFHYQKQKRAYSFFYSSSVFVPGTPSSLGQ
jgi:hypothetical protein